MLRRIFIISCYLLVILLFPGCFGVKSLQSLEISYDENGTIILPINKGQRYVIDRDVDLNGHDYKLPEKVTLISGQGIIKNGTIIGQRTTILGEGALFDHVKIQGSWKVSKITTNLFKDLTYENALLDVIALTAEDTYNRVYIGDGDYFVSTHSYGFALPLVSNTAIELIGRIHLLPNDFKGCSVIGINEASNILIRGSGLIEGDRQRHLGTEGEWGHGINILNSTNVCISEIKISNCWGDCVYVGNESKNVKINGCILEKGRRQGVSITSGNHITVSNCLINDISGTPPQYAIDVEPNENEHVDNVLLENVKANNCYGGFKSWGGASGASIGTVTIRGCSVVSSKSDYPVKLVIGKKILIENCDFETGIYPGIVISVVDEVVVRNNVVRTLNNRTIAVDRAKQETIEKNTIIK